MEPLPNLPNPEKPPGTIGGESLDAEQSLASGPYRVPEGSRLETVLGDGSLKDFLPELPEREQMIILMRNGLGSYEKTTIDRTAQLIDYSR